MKEFEDQWVEDGCCLDINCGNLDCSNCKKIAASWWGKALGWALKHPDLIDHYQLDYVKEELNDE